MVTNPSEWTWISVCKCYSLNNECPLSQRITNQNKVGSYGLATLFFLLGTCNVFWFRTFSGQSLSNICTGWAKRFTERYTVSSSSLNVCSFKYWVVNIIQYKIIIIEFKHELQLAKFETINFQINDHLN